jgi:mRNA-degrading endonuclease RelE of RelBE toxin-antitoxin system
MKCGELKQFQEKCETVFRSELRHLKKQFQEKCEAVFRPESRHLKKQFQEKCEALVRSELRRLKSNSRKSVKRLSVRNCVASKAIRGKVRSGFPSGIH